LDDNSDDGDDASDDNSDDGDDADADDGRIRGLTSAAAGPADESLADVAARFRM
jgi:hypothetical protein